MFLLWNMTTKRIENEQILKNKAGKKTFRVF